MEFTTTSTIRTSSMAMRTFPGRQSPVYVASVVQPLEVGQIHSQSQLVTMQKDYYCLDSFIYPHSKRFKY